MELQDCRGCSCPGARELGSVGFIPSSELEARKLEEAREELGFDPTLTPEFIDAGCIAPGSGLAKRDPKRIVALLCEDNDRQRECWLNASLEYLSARGGGNGLSSYLDSVRASLRPLIGT